MKHAKTLLVAFCFAVPATPTFAASVPYEVAARGCGSRGGPGWRVNSTGQCASKKNFRKACGSPPSTKKCTKEA